MSDDDKKEHNANMHFLLEHPDHFLGSVYHDAGSCWELIECFRQYVQTLRDRQAKRDAEVWAAARLWINGEVFDEKRGMMRGTCYMYDTLEDWEASKK